ncbi:hypothetical protein SK069_19325, partial [Patulibacter brassicae]
MGVLDDAIREHLDLKRRRGADPVDIARQEREALGPVTAGELEDDEPDWGETDDPEVGHDLGVADPDATQLLEQVPVEPAPPAAVAPPPPASFAAPAAPAAPPAAAP